MAADTDTTPVPGLAERERVLRVLRRHEAALRALGVTRLRLFGSTARGEAGPASDVDLIAEIDPEADFSLIDHVGLEYRLTELLGRRVEISTAPWKMPSSMRRRVEAEAVEAVLREAEEDGAG